MTTQPPLKDNQMQQQPKNLPNHQECECGHHTYGDEQTLFMLRREHMTVDIVARFTIDGEPQVKSRPRFARQNGKVRTYTPASVKQAQQVIAWKFRESVSGWKVDSESSFGLVAVFFSDTQQRKDVDNMIKLICDGLNGVVWDDDVQVDEVSGKRGHDVKGNARTEILVYRMGKRQRKQKNCLRCGTKFDYYESTKNKKYCSAKCHYETVKENRTRSCKYCGTSYEKQHAKQQYCSTKCKSDALTITRPCKGCGVEVRRPKSQTKNETWCSNECMRKNKTHCIHGHELTPENIYIAPGTNRKNCRICRTEASRKRRARKTISVVKP